MSISIADYKQFDDLTPEDILLLQQAYIRLRAEGYYPGFNLGDFLDVVLARGEYRDMSTDYIYIEDEVHSKPPIENILTEYED